MLGGGVYITQDKTLPGSYINVVNASSAGSTMGDRGVVALLCPLNKPTGTVIEITRNAFLTDCKTILGYDYNAPQMLPLREVFRHANKVYLADCSAGDDGESGAIRTCLDALEAYEFNVVCVYNADTGDTVDRIKSWRDEMGKKCQAVIYNNTTDAPNHEGVIDVVSTTTDSALPEYALTAWVAGAIAGCKVNESCTNMLYDGELSILTNKTQAQLEECIKKGQIAFHLVYGEVRLLEDINSLTTTTAEKGEDFKYNQTIRVVDQVANDIAKLFNTKYLGRIPNTDSGRTLLWSEIVKHHRNLEQMGAIEAFDASNLKIAQGENKKSVVINDVITVVNSMAQLYMTVVIQ